MPKPEVFRAKAVKATVRIVATLEDGTKRQLFAVLEVHEVQHYLDPANGNQPFMDLKGLVIDGGSWIDDINVHVN